jgi:hypothetical protein
MKIVYKIEKNLFRRNAIIITPTLIFKVFLSQAITKPLIEVSIWFLSGGKILKNNHYVHFILNRPKHRLINKFFMFYKLGLINFKSIFESLSKISDAKWEETP